MDAWLADAADWFRSNGASLVFQVLAFVLLLLAFWVAARIGRGLVRRAIDRSKLEVSSLARDFFIKMTGRLILLFGFIIAIAQLGIEAGPLLAGLGIAGFIIGFALQDTLSNFASGLMILVYRPFDVGNVIEAGGVTGKVDKMNLVSTMVLTFDNQLLVVPNKQIWGGVIRNVTHQDTRRVDMKFGIGYSDNIQKAEQLIREIVTGYEKVLKDPEPVIRLHELGESSLNFDCASVEQDGRILGRVLARDARGEAAIRRRRHFDSVPPARCSHLSRRRRRGRGLALCVGLATLAFAEPVDRLEYLGAHLIARTIGGIVNLADTIRRSPTSRIGPT